MARRLQNQKRSEYQCPPKACPRPASLAGFPELVGYVRKEWVNRMNDCRSGVARARRVTAKRTWPGRVKAEKRGKGRKPLPFSR
jgi:hypothetical protein